jgi:plasmid stabilization system protein ParE
MAARYKLSPHAEEDFASILYGVAEHSGWSRSMDVEESLYIAFNSLAQDPGIGHLRDDLLPRTIHVYYADPYMVLYLRDTEPLYVVAIVHGARNIEALMRDRLET